MNKLSTRLSLAAALTLALATLGAPLAQAAEEPVPDNVVSFNAALTSDYRYRGLSQSRMKPAVQGGADYTHNPSGAYAGVWASTIKWTRDLGGDGNVEIDLYGGKKGEITKGVSYDVGGLYYGYPSNGLHPNANTFELYGQVGMGPVSLKYSHSTTNLFGTTDSKGSGYLDLSANLDLATGLVLNLHVGRQRVAHNDALSYNDAKIGLTKDVGFATVALAVISANTDMYVSPVNGKDLGRSRAVLTVSKTF
ncbi:TorF family putative porin [Massilia sp. DJPM01]|uniref:TorF family putative porin n=1 Tax=Massilia sp. DJPM01 TaxID=3024404 RepID=UPI00259FCA26|nr:TorF family putative porin [Massilia sp. DJPM01]MDM5180793.1 TorF family putative porin [Massilia sp. DJPM01]